jgi:hypothetical protein
MTTGHSKTVILTIVNLLTAVCFGGVFVLVDIYPVIWRDLVEMWGIDNLLIMIVIFAGVLFYGVIALNMMFDQKHFDPKEDWSG